MYTVVLMAALAAGADAPTWCKGKCYGSYGCVGCYCYGGCNACSCTYGCGTSCGYGYGGAFGGYAAWGSCLGCYGGCFGSPFGCHGCYGCYGCYGCQQWAPGMLTPGIHAPPAPTTAEPAPKPKETTALSRPAKLIVELPADAKLYVDDQPIKAEGRKAFATPDLAKGTAYYYMLRAEIVRNGETVTDTKRVVLRAGDEVVASFKDLGNVASAQAGN